MQVTVKRVAALAAAAVLSSAGGAWAVPKVSNVNMQQIGGRMVRITYNLADEDAIVTLSIETNGVAIPDSAVTRLSGDVCKVVQPGEGKSIMWNAGVDWPEHRIEAEAWVTVWSTNLPPLYCAVDLTGGQSANSYPVSYYTSAEALPYGGLTNSIYKSSYLVMRKINNGAFNMGAGVCAVTLTKDFYASVFQVTQGQWAQVMGSWPSYWKNSDWRLTRPVEQVSYCDIRMDPSSNEPPAGEWPQINVLGPNSFMGQLQSKTGLAGFDLPTEAQWEYACRAGTEGEYSDGSDGSDLKARMNLLGRYQWNGGFINGTTMADAYCTTENGTAAVGSYASNPWGLYDMHGNSWELCLDRYVGTFPGGVDPFVGGSGAEPVFRGGSWDADEFGCRSTARYFFPASARGYNVGFRVVRTQP